MPKAVGLDIGRRSMKFVEVEGTPKRYRITGFAEVMLPANGTAGDPAEISKLIDATLKEHKFSRDAVVVAARAGQATIREVSVPFTADDQIRKMIKYEAETHLHAISIDDVVVDYVKVGETADGSRLAVFAMPKKTIAADLALLKAADVDPRSIDLDVAALYNAVVAAGFAEADRAIAVIDIGAAVTNILVVDNGKIRSVRALKAGTDSINSRIQGDLELDYEQAERAKRLADDPTGGDLMVPVATLEPTTARRETTKTATELERDLVRDHGGDFMRRLGREIQRSIGALPAAARIDAFYLTGGGSHAPELSERLATQFGVPVAPLDLLDRVEHTVAADARVSSAAAIAFGLALKQLGVDAGGVDFRQEELRFARKFEIVQSALAVGAFIVFCLVFVWTIQTYTSKLHETQQYDYWLKEGRKEFDTVTAKYDRALPDKAGGHKVQRVSNHLLEMNATLRAVEGVRDELVNELGINPSIERFHSALTLLKELFDRIKTVRTDQVDYMRFDDISISPREVRIKGAVGSAHDVAALVRPFSSESDVYFKTNVKQGTVQAITGGKGVSLDLTIEVKEPAK